MSGIYIGTASWNIPTLAKEFFANEGTHQQRYSRILNAVEINSSFYRTHKGNTYQRWAECVDDDFRFSAKLLRKFTHEQKLEGPWDDLPIVLSDILRLGIKFGVLLVQLPPSLKCNSMIAREFFRNLRENYSGNIVVEPRNTSWLSPAAENVFKQYSLGKVLADPELCPTEKETDFQYADLLYYRLHGSPDMYKSRYSQDYIKVLAGKLKRQSKSKPCWCIFDNTARGFATLNALELKNHLPPLRG
jgi:uncharacterized protein YecE (DUF72 family)